MVQHFFNTKSTNYLRYTFPAMQGSMNEETWEAIRSEPFTWLEEVATSPLFFTVRKEDDSQAFLLESHLF